MWQKAKNTYHLLQAVSAATGYGFPSKGMKIIGITGTDGKTTTASLIYHILKNAGRKAALISTVSAIVDGEMFDTGFHVTTPDPFQIQWYLKKAQKAGMEYVVLEVTSHALDQNRVFGIPFAIGILTNITREHLDYHKTYERYVDAKLKLLLSSKTAIINKDDTSYKIVKEKLLQKKYQHKIITYGMDDASDINPQNFSFKTNLLGEFNRYNILAAASATKLLGIPDDDIREAISSFSSPVGRQDVVYDKAFKVIIDFAHTPNALKNILPEADKLKKNRLIHVFGAAGKRDKFKRPEMGAISSQYADIIVLTAEDPRNEPVEKIMNEIEKGIKDKNYEIVDKSRISNSPRGEAGQESGIMDNKKYIVKIPDRKEAIEFAISLAKSGDVVFLTGKGHEKSMNYGEGETPWDEHQVVAEALKSIAKTTNLVRSSRFTAGKLSSI